MAMKILLLSMPDVVPMLMHESAVHLPNQGIASIGANIDSSHSVYIVDLVRKRRKLKKYLTRLLKKMQPDLIGLSVMTWQYATCLKLIRLIRTLLPQVKIAVGGYHATLMYKEIASSTEADLFDFIVRGEGELVFSTLVEALSEKGPLDHIPSLSYRSGKQFYHNPRAEALDLSRLRLPIRDKRRLTRGYHSMHSRIEVMETSRGCTRNCNFCSMQQMYGRTFRPFSIRRILRDLDDIYYHRKTHTIFIVDDNFVLDPPRVEALCKAIIKRNYRRLSIFVQADCVTMARHPEMVKLMAKAGFKSIFLGVENVSKKNLCAIHKGNIVKDALQAVENCHRYGMMVIAGMIFGFPQDDEMDLVRNYAFFKLLGADTPYFQLLTPYPCTELRATLKAEGLIANLDDFRFYNGLWANVNTRYLSAGRLQYLFWYTRQQVLGWWQPTPQVRRQSPVWTWSWCNFIRPLMQKYIARLHKRYGWDGRYLRERKKLLRMNRFHDLEDR